MKMYLSDNTFLARWISGELTPEEFANFKVSEDYLLFEKINNTTQTLETPAYDKQELFYKLQQENAQVYRAKAKVLRLVPGWAYAVAASVIIVFGVFYFMNSATHYETQFSEQLAITLPDYSKVQLNANSQLEFKSRQWETNREVQLIGEAFFDVEKGMSFKVMTNEGIIEVLGTEFNVTVRDDYFEVRCFEGKVKVVSDTAIEAILSQGEAFRMVNDNSEEWNFSQIEPSWLQGESTFRNTPLSQVIISLQDQFEITFDRSNIDINKRYTGSFTHTDLKLALKTVFAPMEISYNANNENIIVLTNYK
jgi:ferric-dicitrate binding protein FerR (iron transport regulator)